MEKAAGLDHDHTSSAGVRVTVGQPEELRRFGFLGHAASIGRELCGFNPAEKPRRLPKLLGNRSRDRMGRDRSCTPHRRPTPATSARSDWPRRSARPRRRRSRTFERPSTGRSRMSASGLGLISAALHPGFRASYATRRRASANLPADSFAAHRTPWGPWPDLRWLSGNYYLSCRRAAWGR
jgi:hypothetical protein